MHRNMIVFSCVALMALFVSAGAVAAQAMDEQDYNCTAIGAETPFEIRAVRSDCRAFVICAHGRPVRLACPAGLLFNGAIGVCDWSSNVICSVVPAEETSTTQLNATTITTTTTEEFTVETTTTQVPTEDPTWTAETEDPSLYYISWYDYEAGYWH